MKQLTLPTTLTLPTKLPQVRSLPTIEAVPTPPRLPTYNYQAVVNAQQQEALAKQQAEKAKSYTKTTGVLDANDPYALNSLSDALLNRKAKELRYGDFAEGLHEIPVLGDVITSYVAYWDVNTVRPFANLFTGDFKALGLNMLTNFSETMDILANPVKSLITPLVNQNTEDPKYKLPWYERIHSSFGFTDTGRYNYDYDTGFWLADIGLEVISDPINIITTIATFGGSTALKASVAGTAKILGKETGKSIGQELVEKGVKVVSKTGKELSEKAAIKAINRKAIKEMLLQVFNLKKTGNSLSSLTKKAAKASGDDVLRKLSQNFDEALRASKGVIDDSAKSIANSIADRVKELSKNGKLTDRAIKVLSKLSGETDDFLKTANYSLEDLLKASGRYIIRSDKLLDAADPANKRFTKAAYKTAKGLRTEIAKNASDPELVKQLQESLEFIFSDPASIKKYKHVLSLSADNLSDVLKEIDLSDYIRCVNAYAQRSASFKFMSAMDKLGEAAEAVDKAILKTALFSGPAGIAYYGLAKTKMWTRVSAHVTKWTLKRFEAIHEFFEKKARTAATVLLKYDDIQQCYDRVLKELTVFSGYQYDGTDFDSALAKYVYDDTMLWFKGQGDKHRYKPNEAIDAYGNTQLEYSAKNLLLASPEDIKENIKYAFGKDLEPLYESGEVTDDNLLEYFFNRHKAIGQRYRNPELNDITVEEYIKMLQKTDIEQQLKENFNSFNEALGKKGLEKKHGYLKFVTDVDPSSHERQTRKMFEDLEQYMAETNTKTLEDAIKADFDSIKDFNKKAKQKFKVPIMHFANTLENIKFRAENLDELITAFNATKKTAKSNPQKLALAKMALQIEDDTYALRMAASRALQAYQDIKKAYKFKEMKVSKLHSSLEAMASPYFGASRHYEKVLRARYEIQANVLLKNLEILKNKDFQSLINTLRPGQAGRNILDTAYEKCNQEIKTILNNAALDKVAKDFELGPIQLQKEKIEYIYKFLDNVDAYTDHLIMLKQSGIPDAIQNIYLEVLQEYDVRSAIAFKKGFDQHSSEIIKRVNERLANVYSTHSYDLEYFAAKLTNNKDYAEAAKKYLASAHTPEDELDMLQTLFEAEILPELSKTKDILDSNGNVVGTQFVHASYRRHQNRKYVYFNFRTAGENPSLDGLTNLSISCPEAKLKWSADITDETTQLIEFYEQVKALTEDGKELTFIGHNNVSSDAYFLQVRYLEAMEELNLAGDPELYKKYRMAVFSEDPKVKEQLPELYAAFANSIPTEKQELFAKLSEAQEWMNQHFNSANLDAVSLIKRAEGIPTLGEYTWDIRKFLFAHANRQAMNQDMMTLVLNDDVIDILKNIPDFNTFEFNVITDGVYDAFQKINALDGTLSAKGNSYALSGRYLLDSRFYDKDVYSPEWNQKFIDQHTVQVLEKKTELLNLDADGRWHYQGQTLPEDITTANEAVRYLRTQGKEYAPKWKALNPEQQFAAYPVLINGEVSLQVLEGPQLLTVKTYIDTPLNQSFFDYGIDIHEIQSTAAQHTMTVLSQQFSDVLSSIRNPREILETKEIIESVYEKMLTFAKNRDEGNFYKGPSVYRYLKEDLNIYQKYAVLVVALRDQDHYSPRRLISRTLNEKAVMAKEITLEDMLALGFSEEASKYYPDESHKLSNKAKGVKGYKAWLQENPQEPMPFFKNKYLKLSDYENEGLAELEAYTEEAKVDFEMVILDTTYRNAIQNDEALQLPVYIPGELTLEEYNQRKTDVIAARDAKFKELVTDLGVRNTPELRKQYREYLAKRGEIYQRMREKWQKDLAEVKSQNQFLYYLTRRKYLDDIWDKYHHYVTETVRDYDINVFPVKKAQREAYLTKFKELKEAAKAEAKTLNETTYAYENLLRSRAATLIRRPYYNTYKPSKFKSVFQDAGKLSPGYTDNYLSKSDYAAKILGQEQYTSVAHARELYDAIYEANADILQSTKAFKQAMDTHKVYAPSIQRHAVIGYSQVELNNYKLQLVEKYRSGPEFDTFMACEKQLVNNLDDLMLLRILELSHKDLTSVLYHQGKGCIIIPVEQYLKDTAKHSFDVKTPLSSFIKKYSKYEDEFIGTAKVGDNLVIYAKNYLEHTKRELIPYVALPDLSFAAAFEAAYGFNTSGSPNWYFEGLERLAKKYNVNSSQYLFEKNKLKLGITEANRLNSKATTFLYDHWDDIEELGKRYNAHHKELSRLAMDYDHQYNHYKGSYGRAITQEDFMQMHEFLPEKIRKAMYGVNPVNKETAINIYNAMNSSVFDFSLLGRAEYRHSYSPYASSDYHKIMADTYRNISSSLSTLSQYTKFFFDESPLTLNNFFKSATPEEMLIALKQTEDYTVSYLGVDKNGLPKVFDLEIDTLEDIKFAASKNAVLLPNTTHASIVQTVNAKRWSNESKVSQLFHKITYYNKMFTLISNLAGFMFRNTIDSAMKSAMSAGTPEIVTSYADAFRYLSQYEETVNRFFQLSPDNPFKPTMMKEVFDSKAVPMDEETFMLIHNFLESGPSAGQINKVSQFYLEKAEVQPNALQKFFDWTLNPTKQIEQINRLALYLECLKKEMTNTDAFRIVSKTHFDYATKTTANKILEVLIPFSTFQIKNFSFWLDMVEHNPLLMANVVNMFTSQWNWEDIDFERIDAYQSQLNHMMQSNIQLSKSGLTLKLNPSYMDPVSLLLNPVESLSGRVSPLFKPITDALLQNAPYNYEYSAASTLGATISTLGNSTPAGAAVGIAGLTAQSYKSGYKSYQRTGSVLPLIAPSIFGSVKTPTQYGRASYTNSRAFSDPEKRRPRQVSVYHQLYTDSGKNRWQLRYLPVDNFTIHWRIRESTNLFR